MVDIQVEHNNSMADVLVVKDYPRMYPKELLGFTPNRKIKFRIDLVLGTTQIDKAPYRLAPSKMQE